MIHSLVDFSTLLDFSKSFRFNQSFKGFYLRAHLVKQERRGMSAFFSFYKFYPPTKRQCIVIFLL